MFGTHKEEVTTNVLILNFLKSYTKYSKPSNVWERQHNTETKTLVETIRAQRQLDIQNRKFGFISERERNSSFVDYFKEYTCSRRETDSDNYGMANRYFLAFAGHDVIFNDVDEFFCQDYKNFLLSGPGINRRGRPISTNTAVSYSPSSGLC